MPFPIAHPAAVLPLRRFTPHLYLPALIIGSMIPDASYLLRKLQFAEFAHGFTGSVTFDLVAGLVALEIFLLLRLPLVMALPQAYRQLLLPLCKPAVGRISIIASLLIGIWTHLFLDAITHEDGWFYVRLAFMEDPVLRLGRRVLTISDVVWHGISFWGTVWVAATYLGWLESASGALKLALAKVRLRYAMLPGCAVFIAGLGHRHFHYHWVYPLSALTLLLFVLITFRLATTPPFDTTKRRNRTARVSAWRRRDAPQVQ